MRCRPRAAIAFIAIAACTRPDASPEGTFRGSEIAEPIPKPDAQFIDSRGAPFGLVAGTAGTVTLLFFGYTSCPDICPVHLANIAAVLDKLPDEVQRGISVVFVTTDPARDSLPVLHRWVKGFNRDFIGLTADTATIRRTQEALRVLPAQPAAASSDGEYLVGHATQVIAFTKDGLARVQYPFGTRQRDWAHDLPLLLEFGEP